MTAQEFADEIAAVFDEAGQSWSPARSMVRAIAIRRAQGAGLEYQATATRQGFEDRAAIELVEEIEQEVADIPAWLVALMVNLKAQGIEPPQPHRILTLCTALMDELSEWSTVAREAR